MNFIELIQATVAPIVLISAIALIDISLYSRYGRIHDRIRQLLQNIEALTLTQIPQETRERKISNANKQINVLYERAGLSKWSLLLMQFSMITSVMDSILIFMKIIEPLQLDLVIIALFGLSVLLILIGAILTAIEISKSLEGLRVEIEAVTKI